MIAPAGRALAAVASLSALLAPLAAPAQSVAYTVEKIAMEGDPSPIGGTMSQFISGVDLDEDGRVLFKTLVWVPPGPALGETSVLYDGDSLEVVLRDGDPAPGTGGAPFVTFGEAHLGSGGAMTWEGWYETPSLEIRSGAFARSNGAGASLALPGQLVSGGGVFVAAAEIHGMNGAGEVTFHGGVDSGGSVLLTLLLSRSGGLLQVMRPGDPAPTSVGGAFAAPEFAWTAALAADGSVAFWSELQGGSAPQGIFRWSPGGTAVPVLLAGDLLQTIEGGSIEFIGPPLAGNDDGDLCFSADVLRAGDSFPLQGIYVLEDGAHREVIRRGDPLPGLPGETFGTPIGLSRAGFRINAAGDVAFAAGSYETFRRAVFVSRGSTIVKIVADGESVPGVAGAAFTDFMAVASNDAGQIAFYAFTTAGSGVFLATPFIPEVPFAPPWALAVLGVALVLGALRIRR